MNQDLIHDLMAFGTAISLTDSEGNMKRIPPEEFYKYLGVRNMNIQEYTDEYCEGNKAAFARAFDRLPQNVTKLFNDPDQWMVIIKEDVHLLVQVRGSRAV